MIVANELGLRAELRQVAVDESSLILLHPPLHLVGVSKLMERESVSRVAVSSMVIVSRSTAWRRASASGPSH